MNTLFEPERWDVHDRYGNAIYMTAERWQHILQSRPWLADYHADILNTLRHGRRQQDTLNPLPDFNHLVVVVLFGEILDKQGRVMANNYVVTAWPVFRYSKR